MSHTRNRSTWAILGLLLLFSPGPWGGARAAEPKLPSLREQARIRLEWTRARLERILPGLMRQYGVQMWIVICREYNEDPVFLQLVAPTTFAARRRTILVFYDRGPERGVERLALGGGTQMGLYRAYRDPEVEERELWGAAQWKLLRKIVEDRQPATIAVNISPMHAFADGLTVAEWWALQKALGPQWMQRVVHAEGLVLDYLRLRLPEMLPYYRRLMAVAHELIRRAFSREVITPGQTTTEDVVWWLRQQLQDRGLGTWFHPTVRVQRKGMEMGRIVAERGPVTIQPGDVLHVDFGIYAMGLATDTQHMGYVLRPGETQAPPGIRRVLKLGNRLQDLVLQHMKPGRTGNQVLARVLAAMRAAGIDGRVYSHPIGDHGHGAGPLIGLWDRQEAIPGRGDVRILPNTWYSIELSVQAPVSEWDGQKLWVGMEEDAYIDENGDIHWVLARQTRYHLVK